MKGKVKGRETEREGTGNINVEVCFFWGGGGSDRKGWSKAERG